MCENDLGQFSNFDDSFPHNIGPNYPMIPCECRNDMTKESVYKITCMNMCYKVPSQALYNFH